MLLSSFPASLSRSQSFLTRLRHKSRISDSDFGQASFSRCVLIAFLLLEIKPLLEQSACVSKTLGHSLRIEIENGEGNGEIFLNDGVAELGANAGQAGRCRPEQKRASRNPATSNSGRISSPTRRRRVASLCSGNGSAVQPPSVPPGTVAALASTPEEVAFPTSSDAACAAVAKAKKTIHSSFIFICTPSQAAKFASTHMPRFRFIVLGRRVHRQNRNRYLFAGNSAKIQPSLACLTPRIHF